ncbi:hypothetical protein ILT44_29550 [Microvirga sp. BT689]|uniref:DUF6894 family protein n=1 Tax=Microvirga arvi TaxID=2778731 RepID=UPI00194F4CF3|nr:hypothetical protein [Microvirga arvi]MBM6584344.1 hypothetical protein [Microvirga arvi]
MTTFTNGKDLAEALFDIDLSASPAEGCALSRSVPARYFFNLTNGETMIRDKEGIEASSLQAAVISAMEAVEELRAQDPSDSEEWQGWRLEIGDASGQAIQAIPLDILSAH